MSAFGLGDREIAGLAAGVRGAPADDDAAEVFARAAWTLLAEPGDQVAGGLLAARGAAAALEALIRDDRAAAADIWVADGSSPAAAAALSEAAFDRWRPRLAARSVVRALEGAARLGLDLWLPGDPDWPAGFDALGPAAPLAIWVRGAPERRVALGDAVAIVGARAATGYGEHVATELAAGLAGAGAAILSGGAYGIDAAAHRGALAVDGLTVAVLAGGLDRYYPAGNADLLGRVAATGLVLAEVPPGVPPTRFRFLNRNRLLAAGAAATIVVEAGVRSGSLNTANHALAIGRPLGAVPGPITSAASSGCHRLLRDAGAVCITSVDDAIELAGGRRREEPAEARATDPRRIRVLDALPARRDRSPDEIARSSGMAIGEVLGVLGELEADGVARRTTAGWRRGPTGDAAVPPR